MDDIKTVDYSKDGFNLDPLYKKQKEGVAKMRASLLACSDNGSMTMLSAIQNITAMRIYHQLTRIIRYTELMDKLEAKLYESIDNTLDNMNSNDPSTWMMLLKAQEQLQKTMIESHKLLQPYMDVQEFTVVELANSSSSNETVQKIALSPEDRDRLRNKAQSVLQELNGG